jgi:AcrR family transcriptional regulator
MCLMANVRTPRGEWVAAALRALGSGGPDAVRIEALAASLGVTKGGFYWHFKNRQALIDEMLDAWERTAVDAAIERVESEPDTPPQDKFRQLVGLVPSLDFDVELALRDWARRDVRVAERVRRVDNRRMDYMRSLFGEFSQGANDAEARSMLAFSLFIGSYFIAAEHGEKSREEVLQLAVERLLADSWS